MIHLQMCHGSDIIKFCSWYELLPWVIRASYSNNNCGCFCSSIYSRHSHAVLDFFFIWFGAFSKKCHSWEKKKSYVNTLADLIGKHLHWYFICGRKPCSHIQAYPYSNNYVPNACYGEHVEVRILLWLQEVRWQFKAKFNRCRDK